jgi:hypothetical protein
MICDGVVWLPQTVLLGDERDMKDVVAAVLKIRRAIDQRGSKGLVS